MTDSLSAVLRLMSSAAQVEPNQHTRLLEGVLVLNRGYASGCHEHDNPVFSRLGELLDGREALA